MPVRIVVLVNVGPSFGGFRLAFRPALLGLGSSRVFEVLEEVLDDAYNLIRGHPPELWREVVETGLGQAQTTRLGGREWLLEATTDATDDGAVDLVMRAFLPFLAWPFGGWAVYEGWHRSADGNWTDLSEEERAELW